LSPVFLGNPHRVRSGQGEFPPGPGKGRWVLTVIGQSRWLGRDTWAYEGHEEGGDYGGNDRTGGSSRPRVRRRNKRRFLSWGTQGAGGGVGTPLAARVAGPMLSQPELGERAALITQKGGTGGERFLRFLGLRGESSIEGDRSSGQQYKRSSPGSSRDSETPGGKSGKTRPIYRGGSAVMDSDHGPQSFHDDLDDDPSFSHGSLSYTAYPEPRHCGQTNGFNPGTSFSQPSKGRHGPIRRQAKFGTADKLNWGSGPSTPAFGRRITAQRIA